MKTGPERRDLIISSLNRDEEYNPNYSQSANMEIRGQTSIFSNQTNIPSEIGLGRSQFTFRLDMKKTFMP